MAGEAAGSAISSLIGGFTTTAYPQNVALLKVTDEGKTRTRVPVIIAGVVFVVLGFIPKAGAVLSLIPSPVIGGIFLPAAASLISTGLQYAAQGGVERPFPGGHWIVPAVGHRAAERVERLGGRRSRVLLQFDSGWGVLCGDSQGTADRPADLINRRKGNSEAEVPSQI